jgi:hypothetical protein
VIAEVVFLFIYFSFISEFDFDLEDPSSVELTADFGATKTKPYRNPSMQ